MTSSSPCRWTKTKDLSLASFVHPPALLSVSLESSTLVREKIPYNALECIHLSLICNKVRLFSQQSEGLGASAACSVVLSLRPQN